VWEAVACHGPFGRKTEYVLGQVTTEVVYRSPASVLPLRHRETPSSVLVQYHERVQCV